VARAATVGSRNPLLEGTYLPEVSDIDPDEPGVPGGA